MPLYNYQSIDNQGKKRSGFIEALNEQEAKLKLKEQGVYILSLSSKNKMSMKQGLKGDALLTFTIQLSQLINAGLPLYESLLAIEDQVRGEPYHRVILSLCEQVKSGVALSAAMGSFPDSFDKLYCAMVSAGEAAGALGPILEKLSQLLVRQMRLKKQISTAMIYPAILGSFSLVVIGVLLGFVVPSLEGIFADRPLNGFTSFVMGVSQVFRAYWWLFIPLFIGTIATAVWKIRSPAGKIWIQKMSLKIPVIRTLAIQASTARFCRTMATLLNGGLSMIDALRISRGVMQNVVLEEEIKSAEAKIIEGHSLSKEMARSPYFPKMVSRMISVGEESGSTVTMLGKIAEMYEGELEKTLDRVMALAQPVILIFMGMVIGAVLLAVLLPLTDVSSFSAG
jgi:general secretion pathway protein F